MREFDDIAFGGNGDGRIAADDAVWPRLRLWVDVNHDGISQPQELATLAASRVVALETTYVRNNRRDAHGNLFRFKSRAWLLNDAGHRRSAPTYDVYFQP